MPDGHRRSCWDAADVEDASVARDPFSPLPGRFDVLLFHGICGLRDWHRCLPIPKAGGSNGRGGKTPSRPALTHLGRKDSIHESAFMTAKMGRDRYRPKGLSRLAGPSSRGEGGHWCRRRRTGSPASGCPWVRSAFRPTADETSGGQSAPVYFLQRETHGTTHRRSPLSRHR